MFKATDKGKKIVIKDINGHSLLKKNHTYEISQVIASNKINLVGINRSWAATDDCFFFIEEAKSKFEIGDEVIFRESTISIKKGGTAKITGFKDDEKTKIIVDGILPGGWIDFTKLIKLIKIEGYRLKTLVEIVYELGITSLPIYGIDASISPLFGRTLEELGVKQNEGSLYISSPKMWVIDPKFYTKEPEHNYEIYFDEARLKERFAGDKKNKARKDISFYKGKKLSEVSKFNTNNTMIMMMCDEFNNKGYIVIDRYAIDHMGIKIIKLETNENNEGIEANNAIIPF